MKKTIDIVLKAVLSLILVLPILGFLLRRRTSTTRLKLSRSSRR